MSDLAISAGFPLIGDTHYEIYYKIFDSGLSLVDLLAVDSVCQLFRKILENKEIWEKCAKDSNLLFNKKDDLLAIKNKIKSNDLVRKQISNRILYFLFPQVEMPKVIGCKTQASFTSEASRKIRNFISDPQNEKLVRRVCKVCEQNRNTYAIALILKNHLFIEQVNPKIAELKSLTLDKLEEKIKKITPNELGWLIETPDLVEFFSAHILSLTEVQKEVLRGQSFHSLLNLSNTQKVNHQKEDLVITSDTPIDFPSLSEMCELQRQFNIHTRILLL